MNPSFDAIVVVAAWIGGGLITYGVMKAKLIGFERELREVKETLKEIDHTTVRREEYNHRHADLLRNLDRIEDKIDKIESRT